MGLDVELKDNLKKMDEEYGDRMHEMYGPTLLTWPNGVDSARLYMFTSHLKQVLTLLNPDVARIQTGYEKEFGKRNHSYKQLSGTWEVVEKIQKFSDGPIYTIVLYNRETDTYDMIEKVMAENLTEKFGFAYNTDFMDNLNPGDKVTDPILYKSTSYDDNMMYRYGKNANVFLSTSNDTLEDALVVRRGWAEQIHSVEIDEVQVPVNNNDVLLNLYGDDQNYRPLPLIGEPVKNSTLCATRRINKDHVLFDFQAQNMKEINSTDTDYFVTKNSVVYDMDVYYNGDDPFPTSLFYEQLKGYYDQGCEYARKMLDKASSIKASGSNYTDNINFYISKYENWNNPDYKWKNKDKAFANLMIKFKVRSQVSLERGAKLSGRFGSHYIEL